MVTPFSSRFEVPTMVKSWFVVTLLVIVTVGMAGEAMYSCDLRRQPSRYKFQAEPKMSKHRSRWSRQHIHCLK